MSESEKPIETAAVKMILLIEDSDNDSRLGKTIPGFKFDLPPVETLAQLVNNPYLADVLFKVGKRGTLMYAHKNIISLASETFYAQFNKQPPSSEVQHVEPIVVEDVEPEHFMEVLRYIYCHQAVLTVDNMLEVYYVAKKFSLGSLMELCEESFRRKIDDDNVLRVFQKNGKFQFEYIDRVCLDMICDNPLKFFKKNDFIELDQTPLEMIVDREEMNCHASQLERALIQWEDCNKKTDIIVEPRVRLCRRLNFFGRPGYSTYRSSEIRLEVRSRIVLYGVGVFLGVMYDTFVPDGLVTVKVKINQKLVASITEEMSEDLQTSEVFFEKVIVDDTCTMQVIFKTSDNLRNVRMFYLADLTPSDELGSSELTVQTLGEKDRNSVAYFLCRADGDLRKKLNR